MKVFDYVTFPAQLLTPEVCNLIAAIHEYKGKQELFFTAKADMLEILLKTAKIESTEASNKIENIVVSHRRLNELVSENALPQTRSECEITGYKEVLALIHDQHDAISLTPSIIRQLHRNLLVYQPEKNGGHWKNADNVISEVDDSGKRHVRFRPASAFETPLCMDSLCEACNQALAINVYDPLLIIPLFILDFLCVHPFSDGNGRISRLLTLLLLYNQGYIVGKYISLERLINQSRDDYYDTLRQGSRNWHENKNDPLPFVSYTLRIVLKAYQTFESRVAGVIGQSLPKPERIRRLFEETLKPLTKREILRRFPDISPSTASKTLNALQKAGFIVKRGDRRTASYIRQNT